MGCWQWFIYVKFNWLSKYKQRTNRKIDWTKLHVAAREFRIIMWKKFIDLIFSSFHFFFVLILQIGIHKKWYSFHGWGLYASSEKQKLIVCMFSWCLRTNIFSTNEKKQQKKTFSLFYMNTVSNCSNYSLAKKTRQRQHRRRKKQTPIQSHWEKKKSFRFFFLLLLFNYLYAILHWYHRKSFRSDSISENSTSNILLKLCLP